MNAYAKTWGRALALVESIAALQGPMCPHTDTH
jgi:hypothetical protein